MTAIKDILKFLAVSLPISYVALVNIIDNANNIGEIAPALFTIIVSGNILCIMIIAITRSEDAFAL